MSTTQINLSQQYQVITDALNQNQRIVYDTQAQKGEHFVVMTRSQTKSSSFDNKRYITDLDNIKEKIEAFVETHGIEKEQQNALNQAFSTRAQKNESSWFSARRKGARQLSTIQQRVNITAFFSIPDNRELFKQEINEYIANEENFLKGMKKLNILGANSKISRMLKDETIGEISLTDKDIQLLFGGYARAASASQSMLNNLMLIRHMMDEGMYVKALDTYHALFTKDNFAAYVNEFTDAVKCYTLLTHVPVIAKLALIEEKCREITSLNQVFTLNKEEVSFFGLMSGTIAGIEKHAALIQIMRPMETIEGIKNTIEDFKKRAFSPQKTP